MQKKPFTVAYAGDETILRPEDIALLSQAYSRGADATFGYQQRSKGKGKGGKGLPSKELKQATLALAAAPHYAAAAAELGTELTPKAAHTSPRERMLSILSAQAAQAGAIEAHARPTGRMVN